LNTKIVLNSTLNEKEALMTLLRHDLLSYLHQLLKVDLFEDYAPNGLQVEGETEIKKIAFAVSATQDSIAQAISWGAQALIVHHGLFWKHQGSRPITGPWGERVRRCLKHDLNLLAYHLPLDAHPEVGNACALAQVIGLKNLMAFGQYKKSSLGIQGEMDPVKVKDLRAKLKSLIGHEVIVASANEEDVISTLGIITGGANNEWAQAQEAGLDAYLTGEISEYNWHDAIEAGVHYFAAGHHATERFGIQALKDRILQDHPALGAQNMKFFDSPNPA
jgi:dinuclear metal center YbgI/SA1388 family protein